LDKNFSEYHDTITTSYLQHKIIRGATRLYFEVAQGQALVLAARTDAVTGPRPAWTNSALHRPHVSRPLFASTLLDKKLLNTYSGADHGRKGK
jgi:hypothetical protein